MKTILILILGITLGSVGLYVWTIFQKQWAEYQALRSHTANTAPNSTTKASKLFADAMAVVDSPVKSVLAKEAKQTATPVEVNEKTSPTKEPAKVVHPKAKKMRPKAKIWLPKFAKKKAKRKTNDFKFERVKHNNIRKEANCVCTKPKIAEPKRKRRHRHRYKLIPGTFPCECDNPNS